MRAIALLLSHVLVVGPAVELESDEHPAEADTADECDIDEMLDETCEPHAREPAGGQTRSSIAENLKVEARSLAAQGKLDEAISVYERAYRLAPGDHILAYEVGEIALARRDCAKAEEYLRHFIRYSDPEEFSNKQRKAEDMLSRGCVTPAQVRQASEVREAAGAGAPPRPEHPGGAAMAVGATLAGVGAVAIVTGVVLLALSGGGGVASGPMCTTGKRCGDTCISLDKTCHIDSTTVSGDHKPGFVVAGAILIPAGVATLIGGSVLFIRGSRESRQSQFTATPTGFMVRF